MASVKVSMLPKIYQPISEIEKGWNPSCPKHDKTSMRHRFVGIKELVFGVALLSCGIALGLLYARICLLEQRMSFSQRTNTSVVTDANSAAEKGFPIGISSVQTDETINSVDDTPDSKDRRSKRNPSNAQMAADWNSQGLYSNHEVPHDHPFIHVTGITSEFLGAADWFAWHTDEEQAYQNIATSLLPFVNNRFVEIIQTGYYYVYSQVTFSDRNDFAIGHEIVKKPNCGEGDAQRLVNSIRSQIGTTYPDGQPFYPEDSGYIGGVFYLSANDRIAVRPLSIHGFQARRFSANQPTGSYFGVMMMSADPNAPVAETNCFHDFY